MLTVVFFLYLPRKSQGHFNTLYLVYCKNATFRYVDSLVFPAISICNLNDMRLSSMQGTQIDRAIIAADMSLLQNISSEEFTRQIDSAKHKLSDMLVRVR